LLTEGTILSGGTDVAVVADAADGRDPAESVSVVGGIGRCGGDRGGDRQGTDAMPGFQQDPPRCIEPMAAVHARKTAGDAAAANGMAADVGEMLKAMAVGPIADDEAVAGRSTGESASETTGESVGDGANPFAAPEIADRPLPEIFAREEPDPDVPEPPEPPDLPEPLELPEPPEPPDLPQPLELPHLPHLPEIPEIPEIPEAPEETAAAAVAPATEVTEVPAAVAVTAVAAVPAAVAIPAAALVANPVVIPAAVPIAIPAANPIANPAAVSAAVPTAVPATSPVPTSALPEPSAQLVVEPDRAELIRWAAAVAAAGAPAADQNRQLGRAVVEAVIEAGFARYFVPRRYGGSAGGFGELLAAAAQLAEGCASAGWCAALWAAHGRFAAYLPEQGQRDLWGRSPDSVVVAAVLPPAGFAVATGDGWLLRGEWESVGGVGFADWALLAGRTSSSRGPGRVRVFAVPRSEFGVRDTWQATGLRGTGGNTVVVRESFVPDHRSLWLDEVITGDGGPQRDRCHRVPAHLVGGLLFCAPALGAARRALTLWSQWASRPGPSGSTPLADSAMARDVLARTSAEIESAGLMLAAAADRADTGSIAAEAVARNRRDAAFAADLLAGSVERLFRTGGVHVRSSSGELNRCWRDVHTAASYGALRWEAAVDSYANALPTRPEW
jgi:alkylation response protein AidB-like acyl-CoA dehydrogenase